MSKFLLAATISLFFVGTANAFHASCTIEKQTKAEIFYASTEVNFNEPAIAFFDDKNYQKFELVTERVNPDSSIEYVKMAGYNDDQCSTGYFTNSVKTTCQNKKAITMIFCAYSE